MPKCKSCGAEIEFIKMPSGKWMPVEIEKLAVYVIEDDQNIMRHGRQPHWINCPGADKHRRPKITNQEIGPLTKREPGA
jgi:hypothetical protein